MYFLALPSLHGFPSFASPNELFFALFFFCSRFQLSIQFGLPDAATRREVFSLYAKQLSRNELETLATISAGMSGRDMKVSSCLCVCVSCVSFVASTMQRRWF